MGVLCIFKLKDTHSTAFHPTGVYTVQIEFILNETTTNTTINIQMPFTINNTPPATTTTPTTTTSTTTTYFTYTGETDPVLTPGFTMLQLLIGVLCIVTISRLNKRYNQ